MKIFEICEAKNGKRKFKAVLHEIFPDSCIDEVEEAGTLYNENGITWIEEYCKNALPTLVGKSIRCEFLDEDRTELCGHGETDIIDGVAIFENAVMIGVFTDGYITDMDFDGVTKRVCVGEGEIDAACYNNFATKMDNDIAEGNPPAGSVEIQRAGDNEGIVYKYGYKEHGRIPTVFEYSGYALLGVRPADPTAKIIELNNKEDLETMNENEIKALISQTVAEMNASTAEINQIKEDCEAKIAEANEKVDAITNEKNEIEGSVEQIQAALDSVRQEYEELDEKYNALWEEKKTLEKALGEAKAKERIGEMNTAIAEFTDEEKAYAQAEIEAFNAEPINSEINSIVSKIWEGIGKSAKQAEAVIAEQNAAKETKIDDIFGEVTEPVADDDIDIF
ncbi:MAG: hypothetical protein LUC91_00800 [Prevotella sp.]|nr:hypothetical protein [Prevotella sp.]